MTRRDSIVAPVADLTTRAMADTSLKHPDKPMTEIGFRWAWTLEICRHWPDVPPRDAASWMDDYIGAKVGTPGYSWTAADARDLAHEYVAEFGEAS